MWSVVFSKETFWLQIKWVYISDSIKIPFCSLASSIITKNLDISSLWAGYIYIYPSHSVEGIARRNFKISRNKEINCFGYKKYHHGVIYNPNVSLLYFLAHVHAKVKMHFKLTQCFWRWINNFYPRRWLHKQIMFKHR